MRALSPVFGLFAGACALGSEPVGTVDVALTNVPADASCVQVSVVGSRQVVRSFDLRVAQKASFSVTGVPVGSSTITANTFSAPCRRVPSGAAPSSYGDAVSALIRPEVSALAVLPLVHNGQARLGAPRK